MTEPATTPTPGVPDAEPGMNRRMFLRRVFTISGRAGVTGGALTGLMAVGRSRGAPEGARGEHGLLRPPSAEPEEAFLASCIRCTRCADACEPQCIRFFGPGAGTAQQGTPYILPTTNGCTMCLKCGEVCPSGALEPLGKMEDVRMGTAVVDERLCVSHNGTGMCGACHTACPLKNRAIAQDYHNAPTVDKEFCTGCGLCEEACIVDDRSGVRAIQVETERSWNTESHS